MSVANIFVGGDVLLCLTDTITYRNGIPSGEIERKCFISKQNNFAFCVRGCVAFLELAEEVLSDVPCPEHAVSVMRKVFRDIPDELFLSSSGEITIMWFCVYKEAPRAIRFKLNKGDFFKEEELTPGVTLSPDIPGAVLPEYANEDVMVKIALAQYSVKKKLAMDDMCIGGTMHITKIDRTLISQFVAGHYQ